MENSQAAAAQSSGARKFTQGYTFKILLLIAMLLILLIPLAMIRGLVNERGATAREAEAGIMEAWGSELVAVGPMLVVPGVRTEETRTWVSLEGGGREERVTTAAHSFSMAIMPRELDIRADFSTEMRRRGIFSVPLFSGELAFSGSFDPARAIASLAGNEELMFGQAELAIALSSQKGIRRIERAVWDNGGVGGGTTGELFFQPGNLGLGSLVRVPGGVPVRRGGSPQGSMEGGIFAALPGFDGAEASFDIALSMQGGRFARFLPVGQQTRVEISSDWPSPSFQGAFLPGNSEISAGGFGAEWDISYLSRDIPLFLVRGGGAPFRDYSAALFGVNFFRAIDAYSLNARATRYAVIFLVIPFLALFMLEARSKKRIHPAQYLLSGIANVVFYLLLLSLSEHMRFHFAYLLAALSVAALLTLYSRSLLQSWKESAWMALSVAFSYILLYAILNAESLALLIGSIYAFALVALVMFFTRKMDWYGIGQQIRGGGDAAGGAAG